MSLTLLQTLATPTASDIGPDGSPSERAEQFVAVSGPLGEQVSASGMVIGAYGLFWLIVFAVVVLTFRSQTKLLARIDELEKRLPKDEQSK